MGATGGMFKTSFILVTSLVVALYIWRVLEDTDGGAALTTAVPNVNKGYCLDCKALWTPRGWIEYQIIKGRGPSVLILHGTPGGVDQALLFGNSLFPSTKDPKPLLPVAEETLTPTERLLLNQRKPPYTLIFVSRPGYLRTTLSSETETVRQQSELLGLLLDELDLDSVAVVGLSGGAVHALDFALSQPNRTWGLVLVGDSFGAFSHWAVAVNQLLSQFLPRSLYNYLYNFVEYGIKSGWVESKDLKMLLTATALFPFREKGYNNDIKQLNDITSDTMKKMLANVTMPTLIVQGTSDGSENNSKGSQTTTTTTTRGKIVRTTVAGLDDSHLIFPYRKVAAAINAFFEKHLEFLVYPDYPDILPSNI